MHFGFNLPSDSIKSGACWVARWKTFKGSENKGKVGTEQVNEGRQSSNVAMVLLRLEGSG